MPLIYSFERPGVLFSFADVAALFTKIFLKLLNDKVLCLHTRPASCQNLETELIEKLTFKKYTHFKLKIVVIQS